MFLPIPGSVLHPEGQVEPMVSVDTEKLFLQILKRETSEERGRDKSSNPFALALKQLQF